MSIAGKHNKFVNEALPKLTGKQGLTGKDKSEDHRIRKEFEYSIKITFDTIRSYRNFAAHPYNGIVPKEIIRDNLTSFPLFCQRLYHAIGWLISNKV